MPEIWLSNSKVRLKTRQVIWLLMNAYMKCPNCFERSEFRGGEDCLACCPKCEAWFQCYGEEGVVLTDSSGIPIVIVPSEDKLDRMGNVV